MSKHIPVLVKEATNYFRHYPKDSIIVDATFGNGGYCRELLQFSKIIAIDKDPLAFQRAQALQSEYPNIIPIFDSFSQLPAILKKLNIPKVDGILLDIGMSSFQLDDASRGFSFKHNGPLDMRFSLQDQCLTAETIVNTFSEEQIAQILRDYGEEKLACKISKEIVKNRPLHSTQELADIVTGVFPFQTTHPAKRTFQALRIYVNDELNELKSVLEASEKLLNPNGRIAIVTFHSLEDRIVKQFFREKESGKSAWNPKMRKELREK
jgi:16S rRNA (cytosine1402-N4)-methyltransferase